MASMEEYLIPPSRDFLSSKQFMFEKSPRFKIHSPNLPGQESFYIRNCTDRTLRWDFANERIAGPPIRYPAKLGMQHLPPHWHSEHHRARGIAIGPHQTMEGRLTFKIEIDPQCEREDADASYVTGFQMGLDVYERKTRRDGTYINAPISYSKELFWPVVVPHHAGGDRGQGRESCATLFITLDIRDHPEWSFTTKTRQYYGSRWMH